MCRALPTEEESALYGRGRNAYFLHFPSISRWHPGCFLRGRPVAARQAGPAAQAFRQGNRLANNCLPQGCRECLRTSLSCHVRTTTAAELDDELEAARLANARVSRMADAGVAGFKMNTEKHR